MLDLYDKIAELKKENEKLQNLVDKLSFELRMLHSSYDVNTAELNKVEINFELLKNEFDFLRGNFTQHKKPVHFDTEQATEQIIAQIDPVFDDFNNRLRIVEKDISAYPLDKINQQLSDLKQSTKTLGDELLQDKKYNYDRQQFYTKQLNLLQKKESLTEKDLEVILVKFQKELLQKIKKERLGEKDTSIFYLEQIPMNGKINHASLKKQYQTGKSIYELKINEINSKRATFSLYLTEVALKHAVKFKDLAILPFFYLGGDTSEFEAAVELPESWSCNPAVLKRVNGFWEVEEKGGVMKKDKHNN